jgi:hypothetical protein
MTAQAEETNGRTAWMRGYGVADKICRDCGDAFYTNVGLAEHMRIGAHVPRVTRRWTTGVVSPAGLARLQERGRQIAAENNARRRRCDTCGLVSTSAGIGTHQKFTGHIGWTSTT